MMTKARTGAWLLLVGCAAREDDGVVVATAKAALTDGSVKAINGTYNGCLGRTGAWSVRVGGSEPLDHDALSVVKNDVGCQLLLNEIVTSQTYTAAAPLPLTTSYQAFAVAFHAGAAFAFSANAKVDGDAFASDFQITLLHAADPSAANAGAVTSTYASVASSAVSTVVAAPSYTISLTSGVALSVQMNAASVVTASAGSASLTDGATLGTSYVVDQGTLPASPTYADVVVASLGGTTRTISGANPTIPASDFGLVGANLTTAVTRTVIVQRVVGGVAGYQLFKVTFKS